MVIAHERRLTAPRSAPALIWSALTICLGLWWRWQPQHYPFGPGDPSSFGTLLGVVPAAAVPPFLVAAGAWGMVAAWLAARRQMARGTTATVVGTATVYAVVFGLVTPGVQPLTLLGYATAMLGPLVLFGVVLAGAWRWRGGPCAVAVFELVAALAWFSGLADGLCCWATWTSSPPPRSGWDRPPSCCSS